MAFTLTKVRDGDDVKGRDRSSIYDVQITGSYTAGGYTIAAADVGLKGIKSVKVAGGDVSQLTYFPFFDFGAAGAGNVWGTGKLRLGTATGVEATGSLSPTVNLRLEFFGN